ETSLLLAIGVTIEAIAFENRLHFPLEAAGKRRHNRLRISDRAFVRSVPRPHRQLRNPKPDQASGTQSGDGGGQSEKEPEHASEPYAQTRRCLHPDSI